MELNLTLKKVWVILSLCFVALLASRLYPLVKYGPTGMGYDTGFYKLYTELPFDSFPRQEAFLLGPDAVGTRIILDISSIFIHNSEITLFGTYILFNLITALLIYLLTKTLFKSELAGFTSMIIYVLSPTQYLTYQFMFYKEMWAGVLLLLTFYLFEKKSWLALFSAVWLIISHKTSAFIFILSSAPYLLIEIIKKRKILLTILSTIILIGAIWLNYDTLKNLLIILKNGFPDMDLYNLKTGLFIETHQYLEYAILYLPFGLIGIWLAIRKKSFSPILFLTLICAILVIGQSYFYKRIITFLDLGLIIFAGGGINWAFQKTSAYKKHVQIMLTIFLCLLTLQLVGTVKKQKPVVMPAELDQIKKMRDVEKGAYVMTFSSKYASWLYGWAGPDKRVISPGLFWDRWNLNQWIDFWNGTAEKQKGLLASYQAPLYIFDPQKDYSANPCFEKLNPSIWKFKCY